LVASRAEAPEQRFQELEGLGREDPVSQGNLGTTDVERYGALGRERSRWNVRRVN
jgi:hypothetical protein